MSVLLILTICLVRTSSEAPLTEEILKFFRSDFSSSLIWDDQLSILTEEPTDKHSHERHVPSFSPEDRNVSHRCLQSLSQVAVALKNGENWAYRFLDASAKTPSGLLDGTVSSFGDYDECLDIKSPSDSPDLQGQYCLPKFTAGSLLMHQEDGDGGMDEKKNESASRRAIASEVRDSLYLFDTFTLNLGICVPRACDGNDLRFLLSHKLIQGSLLQLHPDPIFCDSHESNSITFNKLSLGQMISLSYLTLVISLVYVATIVHLLKGFRLRAVSSYFSSPSPIKEENERKMGKGCEMRKTRKRRFSLRFFSLVHNMNQLLAPARSHSKREGSVDDIRFAFAIVTTLVHASACGLEFRSFAKIFRLRTDFYDKFKWFMLQPFFNVVGIEGFFCIS
jgi:hypothetical protein